MTTTIFIEAAKLGSIVEGRARGLSIENDRKSRSRNVKALARVLRDLHLVSSKEIIRGLAIGCQSDGTFGLFIVLAPVEQVRGNIAAEQPNEESALPVRTGP